MVREEGSVLLMLLIVGVVLSIILFVIGSLLSQKIFLAHREKVVYEEVLLEQERFDHDIGLYLPFIKYESEPAVKLGVGSDCLSSIVSHGDDVLGVMSIKLFLPGCFGESYRYSVHFARKVFVGVGQMLLSRTFILDWDEYFDEIRSSTKELFLSEEEGGGVSVLIRDVAAEYAYRIEVSQDLFVLSDSYLGVSETQGSFFMVLNGWVWALSKQGGFAKIANLSSNSVGEVVADYIIAGDLFLLVRHKLGGQFYFEFLKISLREGLLVPDRFWVEGLEVQQDYEVVDINRDGVLLESNGVGRELLAFNWLGKPRWGSRYLWLYGNNIQCGIGREVFEPRAGYVIGCQRKRQ